MPRSSKEVPSSLLKPSDLNLWFGTYNHGHPLLADDYYLAALGSMVSWERMFIYFAATTNGYRDPYVDPAVSVQDWQQLDSMDELPGLDMFDALWAEWTRYRDGLLERRKNDGVPLPKPKPPEPPKPEPKPPEPKPEPNRPIPDTHDPSVPDTPTDWKARFKWIGGVCSAILALGIFAKFIPVLAPFWSYIEVVLKLIEGIFK